MCFFILVHKDELLVWSESRILLVYEVRQMAEINWHLVKEVKYLAKVLLSLLNVTAKVVTPPQPIQLPARKSQLTANVKKNGGDF